MNPSFLHILLVLLFCASFVKIFTALTIFRFGIGLEQAGLGFILFLVSIAFSYLILMSQFPTETSAYEFLSKSDFADVQTRFKPYLKLHTDQMMIDKVVTLESKIRNNDGSKDSPKQEQAAAPVFTDKEKDAPPDTPFHLLLTAYTLTQLTEAFKLGILIIIPFIVIDLVVANLLLSLGITQLKTELVSIPLKLIVFVAADGWSAIMSKIV